jgi:ligand-binding SRPBCC domain-containing protein
VTEIQLITFIDAPVEICFQLSLSIELELEAAKAHRLRAVSGVTSGNIGPGERVGWQTRQFGIIVSHLSEISGFDRPVFFQDTMVKGLFRSFRHDHFFRSLNANRTEMRDEMRFRMPLWLMGLVSERMVMRARLTTLLKQRNQLIKEAAEGSSV